MQTPQTTKTAFPTPIPPLISISLSPPPPPQNKYKSVLMYVNFGQYFEARSGATKPQ